MRDSAAIRVLVHGANYLLEAVEQSLGGQSGIRIVNGSQPGLALVGEREEVRADVVVTSLGDQEVQMRYRNAFFTEAGVPFIAISEDRRRVRVYDQWEIREVAIDELAAAVRELARHKRHPRPRRQTRTE